MQKYFYVDKLPFPVEPNAEFLLISVFPHLFDRVSSPTPAVLFREPEKYTNFERRHNFYCFDSMK